nr:hypothetical protein B0A51_14201 [Rachicladosporium sp. CCFEE 5018]
MNAIEPEVTTPSDQAANNTPSPSKAVPFTLPRGRVVRTWYDMPTAGSGVRPKLVGSSHDMTDAEVECDLKELEEILAKNRSTDAMNAAPEAQERQSAVHAAYKRVKLPHPITKQECLQQHHPLVKFIILQQDNPFTYINLDRKRFKHGQLGGSSAFIEIVTGSRKWRLQIRMCLLYFTRMVTTNIIRRKAGNERSTADVNASDALMVDVTGLYAAQGYVMEQAQYHIENQEAARLAGKVSDPRGVFEDSPEWWTSTGMLSWWKRFAEGAIS